MAVEWLKQEIRMPLDEAVKNKHVMVDKSRE